MVGRETEELSEEERKALRGSKFAPLPPPSSSRSQPRLAHPGGPLTTNKAAALAKFLERKLQDPNGLSSINPDLLELAVNNAKATVFQGGASSSGSMVRHVDSFGDSEDSLEEANLENPEPKKDKKKKKKKNKIKKEKKKNKKKKVVVEDHECSLKRPKKKGRLTASQSYRLFFVLQSNPSLRLFSTTPNPQSFTVSYLINTCGLSPESAFSASKFVDFETPDKPDSVIAFFKNHGFSETQITTLIRGRPKVLVSDVKCTLSPNIEFFKSKGVSSRDLAKTLLRNPTIFGRSLKNHIIPSFNCLRNLLKSDEAAIKAITRFPRLLTYDLDNSILPNIDTLQKFGVPESNIVKVLHSMSRIFLKTSVEFKETVEKVKEMGFNPLRMTFVLAVSVLNSMTESMWDRKFYVYKNCGWSEKEIIDALRKYPSFLTLSEEQIVKKMDFLVSEMGLQPSLIAKRPRVITQSLEKRIVPRGLFAKDLLSRGLVKKELNLEAVFEASEKSFIEKFVNRYEADAPELLKLYQEKFDLSNNRKAGISRVERM
ncbi:hypothetical protein PTKIN_Ptkin09bG0022300 [Pterospermum kingtungense]